MPKFLCETLAACAFVALLTTAVVADLPDELVEDATQAAGTAVETTDVAPVVVPQPEPPQPDPVARPFQPMRAHSGEAGVVFRPPKRPSQVKQVPPGQAAYEPTGDATGDEPAAAAEPAKETSAPAQQEGPAVPEGPAEQEDQEQAVAPPLLPSAVETADQPKPADEPKIGTMSFNGVEPGKTTLVELKKQWGEPAGESTEGVTALYTFTMEPFKQIDVTTEDDLVTSVVVYLDPPMLPAIVADELRLRKFTAVPVPDASGQLLGQVYPERGVLFGFAADANVQRVAQIVVEPISAEPFVLRALYDFNHRYSDNLKDLDFALSRDDNNAQAHWVKSRVLAEIGRYKDAVTEARTAVRLEPSIPTYRLELAHNLGLKGRYDEATEIVEAIRAQKDIAACVKARAECELARLLANRPKPDYKYAIAHYQAAINLASPLVGESRFEIRRTAKQILIEANAGIGLGVALGNYQRKPEVAAKWLDRAGAYADQYVGGDNGPKDLPLTVFRQRLAAYAGMNEVDPSQTADAAIQTGRRLITWSDDPLFQQQVEWSLGSVLMDAVRVEHARGEHLQALRYAEMAVGLLESAIPERQLAPAEQFALGRFYFLAGAVYAVQKQDHPEAATWYAKALPLLISPATAPADGLTTGRLGEWLVSMGVTFWEVGNKPKALELTERGADLVQQAVAQGIMKKAAVAVPFSNLATMHGALGNEDKASSYGRLAKAAESATAEMKRR